MTTPRTTILPPTTTADPWTVHRQAGANYRVTSKGRLISSHLTKRDAYLIAAAPTMAAALERAARFLSASLEGSGAYDPCANELEHIRAALNLAKGPTQ